MHLTTNSTPCTDPTTHFQQKGFSIVPHLLTETETDAIIEQLEKQDALQFDKQQTSDFNLIHSIPFIHKLAHGKPLMLLVKQILGGNAHPINAFVLDKTQSNNWGLDWHQDLKIAVKTKVEAPGYGNWTVESGIHHVMAPTEILEKKLSVRIHLDDCTIHNGALLVVPGSHTKGILKNKAEMDNMITGETAYCEMKKGGIMIMTPLLLHKSPYSTTYHKRRVLQIDYAGINLSHGLEWYH